ncbi:MAG: hypothetical protein ACK6DU_09285 [Planctomycetota bacterium]
MPAPSESSVVYLDRQTGSPVVHFPRRSAPLARPLWGVALSLSALGLILANTFTGGALLKVCLDQFTPVQDSAEPGLAKTGLFTAQLAKSAETVASPFGLPSHNGRPQASLAVAAVVLDVENRPDQEQAGPTANPANQSPANGVFRKAAAPLAVPMLTPQQAEQVFDPPAAEPLLPQNVGSPSNGLEKKPQLEQPRGLGTTGSLHRSLSRPTVRRMPWTTLPLNAQDDQAGVASDSLTNPEADLDSGLRQVLEPLPIERPPAAPAAPAAGDSTSAAPLPLEPIASAGNTDKPQAGAAVEAPLVPLEHSDGTGSQPDPGVDSAPATQSVKQTESAPIQLAPSDEITPLEPKPLRPAFGLQPLRAQPSSTPASQPATPATLPSSGSTVPAKAPEAIASPAEPAPEKRVAPWPRPEFLLNRVAEVTTIPGLEPWVQKTTELLEDLHVVSSLSDREVVTILGELERQTVALEPLVIRFSTVAAKNADEAVGPESIALRRLAYKLRQQIDVWYASHELAVRNFRTIGDFDSATVLRGLQVSRQKLTLPGVSPEWQRYLVLDQVETAFNSSSPNPQEQRAAARRFLSRLHSPILSEPQRQFLATQFDTELVEQLKSAAREEIRLEQLLTEVEAIQENRNGVAQHRVNQMFQNLAWQDDPAARELAATIDTHFRNANFRISVSDEMLNLLLPDADETQEPVNENVFGAEVRGQSRVANRLQIRLIPDTSRIQMRLEAIGKVLSQTEAQRSGFTVQSEGDARFQVFKRLAIGREGIITDQPEAWSRATNRMVGMQSELDGVPVLGWVARRIAERKIAEQSPQVERYTRRKLETTIKHRFNSEIERQLSEMQQYLNGNMIQPLTALELEPTPLEMRSTEERVIMRYRLAGFDQMGGNTARPRGLQNSLLSMQIHETSINNLLNRIDLNGEEFTTDELTSHLANVFGWQTSDAPQAREATFEFAHFDPIRVTFSHGSAAVQLNLKRLRIGNGKTWKNLSATCNFIPQTEGGKIVFVQDGSGVELSGHRLGLRDQVAVRAIFTALFKDQYELPILPKNIAQKLGPSAMITQLELNDGWIGLSVDKRENLTPQRISELEASRTGSR